MTKAERLEIESRARIAIGKLFNCAPSREAVEFPGTKKKHEFDIFSKGIVIGGVSTSPYLTSGRNINTGGCDRAASELLWLSLWQGSERRVHVLTDSQIAQWILGRYQGLPFPFQIEIYNYDPKQDTLAKAGKMST